MGNYYIVNNIGEFNILEFVQRHIQIRSPFTMNSHKPNKAMFASPYEDSDYQKTKSKCEDSALQHAPISSQLATMVDKFCAGTLGTKAHRKLLCSITHLACGNTKLMVSKGRLVKCTYALKQSGPVGSAKSIGHNVIADVVHNLSNAIAQLDKQLWVSKQPVEDVNSICNKPKDKGTPFERRVFLINPGTLQA